MLISKQKNENFLNCIIIIDYKLVMYDNCSRKIQWLSPFLRPTITAKPNIHREKVILSVWWSVKGIMHCKLLQHGETITLDVYCAQLERLKGKLEKCPASAYRNGVIIHQDNARFYIAKRTVQRITKFGSVQSDHCTFWLLSVPGNATFLGRENVSFSWRCKYCIPRIFLFQVRTSLWRWHHEITL